MELCYSRELLFLFDFCVVFLRPYSLALLAEPTLKRLTAVIYNTHRGYFII